MASGLFGGYQRTASPDAVWHDGVVVKIMQHLTEVAAGGGLFGGSPKPQLEAGSPTPAPEYRAVYKFHIKTAIAIAAAAFEWPIILSDLRVASQPQPLLQIAGAQPQPKQIVVEDLAPTALDFTEAMKPDVSQVPTSWQGGIGHQQVIATAAAEGVIIPSFGSSTVPLTAWSTDRWQHQLWGGNWQSQDWQAWGGRQETLAPPSAPTMAGGGRPHLEEALLGATCASAPTSTRPTPPLDVLVKLESSPEIASEVRKKLFLPVFVDGKRIIAETKVNGQYLVDNSQFAIANTGISYRNSRNLDDRAGYGPDWFSLISGTIHEDWLEVEDGSCISPPFEAEDEVEYWSDTCKTWTPAIVKHVRGDGITYDLDGIDRHSVRSSMRKGAKRSNMRRTGKSIIANPDRPYQRVVDGVLASTVEEPLVGVQAPGVAQASWSPFGGAPSTEKAQRFSISFGPGSTTSVGSCASWTPSSAPSTRQPPPLSSPFGGSTSPFGGLQQADCSSSDSEKTTILSLPDLGFAGAPVAASSDGIFSTSKKVRGRKRETQEEEVATAEAAVPEAAEASATAEVGVPAQVAVTGRFRGVIDIDPVDPVATQPLQPDLSGPSGDQPQPADEWPADEEVWPADSAADIDPAEGPDHSTETEVTGAEEEPEHPAEAEATAAEEWWPEQPEQSRALDAIHEAEGSISSSENAGLADESVSGSGASRSDADHYDDIW